MLDLIRLIAISLVAAKIAFIIYTIHVLYTFNWSGQGIPWYPILLVILCAIFILPSDKS